MKNQELYENNIMILVKTINKQNNINMNKF